MSKKTSIFDWWVYIFAIGAGVAVLGSALWLIIIGAIVFVVWMIIREIFGNKE